MFALDRANLLLSILIFEFVFFLIRVPLTAVPWSTCEGQVGLDGIAGFLFFVSHKHSAFKLNECISQNG